MYCLFFHPKLSNIVLHAIPNACDTTVQYNDISRLCDGAAFARREKRDLICPCTNENAQLQSADGIGQLATTDWAQPN